ncbi:amino acid-binding protein [Propionibacteriaceae bacterium Y1923]
MGTAGADISAIEIIEKGPGYAINDFRLTMAPDALPDTLISACAALEDVRVLWLSHYPENWGLASDIDTLNEMTAHPDRALEILVQSVPVVFHAQWALVLDADRTVVQGSALAPELDRGACELFAPFDEPHVLDLPEGWLPGWGETWVAVTPMPGDMALVAGRLGGPEFLESEVRRLHHLAALAQ